AIGDVDGEEGTYFSITWIATSLTSRYAIAIENRSFVPRNDGIFDNNSFHVVGVAAESVFFYFVDHDGSLGSYFLCVVFARYLYEEVVEPCPSFLFGDWIDVVYIFALGEGSFSGTLFSDVDHLK